MKAISDSINRGNKHYGVPETFINTIYEGLTTHIMQVLHNTTLTEKFQILPEVFILPRFVPY